MNKKAGILNRVIVQIILIALIFSLFFMANAQKINSRGLRQQIIEKQTALIIDSAISGMSFEISKNNINGFIEKIEIKNGRVYATIDGLFSAKGYPFFSPNSVIVEELEDKFLVKIYG